MAKEIAKKRDGYCCCYCGSSEGQIHGSHVIPVRGKYGDCKLSVNPINIKALCANCHRGWHSSPAVFGVWFVKRYPSRWVEIVRLHRSRIPAAKVPASWWRAKEVELMGLADD